MDGDNQHDWGMGTIQKLVVGTGEKDIAQGSCPWRCSQSHDNMLRTLSEKNYARSVGIYVA